MSDNNDRDNDGALVESAVNALAEHFDTVQIFCTRHEAGEKDGTVNVQLGAGNWFARWGQIEQWMTIERGRATEHGAEYDRQVRP